MADSAGQVRRLAVLGADGFIGRHLVSRSLAAGWQVRAATRRPLDRSLPGLENVVSPFSRSADFGPLIAGCDAIIHAASISTPGTSDARPQLEGNLDSLLALLDALQDSPQCRLLYLSSGGTLYGDRAAPVAEDAPLQPTSYHGAGKAAAEQFIRAYAAQFHGDVCVLRPANVYGPGQPRRPEFGIIPAALACAQSGAPLTLWGDGSAVRDFLFIDDLVELCLHALAPDQPPGLRTFNASTTQGVSLLALLQLIREVTGARLEVEFAPARRVDVQRIVPDNAAARAAFGWTPAVTLRAGLERTWAWFRKPE